MTGALLIEIVEMFGKKMLFALPISDIGACRSLGNTHLDLGIALAYECVKSFGGMV